HGRSPGHDVAAGEGAFPAVEIGDDAAGLAHQQRAGADVPGRQAELEESVVDAGGRIGQVEGGGAAAADRLGVAEDVTEDGEVHVQRRESAKRKPGRQEGAVQSRAFGDPYASAVPERAAAAHGAEQVAAFRILDDAGEQLVAAAAGDGDAVDRQTLEKVGGTVERI